MAEDLGFPGNRELLERQLATATTQVLFLAQDAPARHHSLAERGAELVRGLEIMPAAERFWTAEPSPAAAGDGIPADIAEAYLRARSEVKTILAEAFPG